MEMVFRDDESRLRTDHPPANFCTLKQMAQNLITLAPGKSSLRQKRMAAGWDDDFLASLITPPAARPGFMSAVKQTAAENAQPRTRGGS